MTAEDRLSRVHVPVKSTALVLDRQVTVRFDPEVREKSENCTIRLKTETAL